MDNLLFNVAKFISALPKLFFNDSLEKIKRPNKNYNDCTVNVHKKEEEFYYDLKKVFKEHACDQ